MTAPPRSLSVDDLRAGRASLDAAGHLELRAPRDGAQGRRQGNGAAAEDLVGQNHARCLAAGVAYIRKCDPTFRVLGEVSASDVRGPAARVRELVGKLFGFFERAAGVDYLGWTLTPLGTPALPIVAEAKHTEDGRVSLVRVEPGQRHELELATGRALAALLVVHARVLYAVPWAEVRGRASVHVRELAAYAVPPGVCWPAHWTAGKGRVDDGR